MIFFTRSQFSKEMQKELSRENRNDIISVPFALIWQITLFLLPMQLVIKSYSSFWMTLPIFALGCGGMYWFWWRNLPKAGEERQPIGISEKAEPMPVEAE